MQHDIRAMFKRAKQIGRGEGVVDHQGNAVRMGHVRHRPDIHHLQARIAQGFTIQQPGVGPDRGGIGFRIAWVHECCLDTETRKGMGEHIVAAAIDRSRRHNMTALPHQGRDTQMQGGLPGGGGDGADPAFQGSDAFLQHGHRGI